VAGVFAKLGVHDRYSAAEAAHSQAGLEANSPDVAAW
jgi:hypothetical protein